jgi:phosphoribosylamine--glycine ligase
MNIAFSSYSGYGAWFVLKLLSEGHKVDYFLSKPDYADILGGLIPKPKLLKLDHRISSAEGAGYPSYEKYDLSVFDLTGRKKQADYSVEKTPTIGDGSMHCMLEDDRMIGVKIMEECGIKVPPYEEFTDTATAKALVKKTGKRYVFKPNGGQDQDAATTYVATSAEDMLEYIDKVYEMSKGAPFILQEFIPGVEVSTEGWFNGTDFYLLNCTIEDKKFMNDNKGPNTGCAGNIVFTINQKNKIYEAGLLKAKEFLSLTGFKGMIDLNTIVTETDIWGLEWTPRFGYDASATLVAMYANDYGKLLHATAAGEVPDQGWKAEFGVSARLTIPPYPTEIKLPKIKNTPIKGLDCEDMEALLECFLYDVYSPPVSKVGNKSLLCAGHNGFLMAPICVGNDLPKAFESLMAKIDSYDIPDVQYRTDIGKSTMTRYKKLKDMGWI